MFSVERPFFKLISLLGPRAVLRERPPTGAEPLWEIYSMVDDEELLHFIGGCVGLTIGLRSIVSRWVAVADYDDFWV